MKERLKNRKRKAKIVYQEIQSTEFQIKSLMSHVRF